jgi:hypothetical protein
MATPAEQQSDQRDFNRRLIATLERLGIDYAIGGSVAAMVYSEPRSTIDIDLMIQADHSQLEILIDEITRWQVYVDPVETLNEFLQPNRMPINVVDGISGVKADLYVAHQIGLDSLAISRKRRMSLYEKPLVDAWFLSPEDVILYKLDYFRQSDGVSTKHPRDIGKMLRVVGDQLDLEYLERWASEIGVSEIWQAIWREHQDRFS